MHYGQSCTHVDLEKGNLVLESPESGAHNTVHADYIFAADGAFSKVRDHSLSLQGLVYLHREAIDFRKNINGLAALVEQSLGRDPFAQAVYVFRNRRTDRIKILGWDGNGFWLLTKRLEQDRFTWPRRTQPVIGLSVEQLHWLLDGIDIDAMRRQLHVWIVT